MSLRLRSISYNQSVDWNLGHVHTEQKRKRSKKERKTLKKFFAFASHFALCEWVFSVVVAIARCEQTFLRHRCEP